MKSLFLPIRSAAFTMIRVERAAGMTWIKNLYLGIFLLNNFFSSHVLQLNIFFSDLESQSNSTNQRGPFLDFIHQGVFCQGDSQGVTKWSKDGDVAGGTKILSDGIQVLVVLQLQTDNDLARESPHC